MATIESAKLAIDFINWCSNLRKNIRDNANQYEIYIANGNSTEKVVELMTADAQEYLKTVAALEQLLADPEKKQKLLDGLALHGLDEKAAADELTVLRISAEKQLTDPKAGNQDITALSAAICDTTTEYVLPKRAV